MSRELYLQWSSASARDKRKSRHALECPGLAHDAVKDSRGERKAFLEDPTIPTAVQQPRPKGTTHGARATQKLEVSTLCPVCCLAVGMWALSGDRAYLPAQSKPPFDVTLWQGYGASALRGCRARGYTTSSLPPAVSVGP